MGIKGIYREIGSGQRIALSRLAVQTFELKRRPFRLAIDISIWLFQIQSGKGGTNPALRTFYYRLLRLMTHSIHPLFVFDGPNKPPFKRNKRTGPNIASIPAFLAKELLKKFGVPYHTAPGEAEAECALLQQKGVVDAVLSEDVDTLMFGSGLTLRNWSAEGKGKVPTHVNVYDAEKTRTGPAGLDREGMILVALMSGGDYIPEGIPGCGPKLACETARAGFGADLCKLSRNDPEGILEWKNKLSHELRSNDSKFFKSKHPNLQIPEDFPRMDILRYYTHPCLSSPAEVENLRNSISWDQEFDVKGLRKFTGDAFDWICVSGAKKFIRNLAPALLMRELRLRGASAVKNASVGRSALEEREDDLIKSIYTRRNHATTDRINEIRIGYVPMEIVNIDLSEERPDPELPQDDSSSDEQAPEENETTEQDVSTGEPSKRNPSNYDPSQVEKIWVLEQYLKAGVPTVVREWEESSQVAKERKESKEARKRITRSKKLKNGGMPPRAIESFTRVVKPGLDDFRGPATLKMVESASEKQPDARLSTPDRRNDSTDFRAPASLVEIVSSPEVPPSKRTRTLVRSSTGGCQKIRRSTKINFQSTLDTLDLSGIGEEQSSHESGDPFPIFPGSVTLHGHRSPSPHQRKNDLLLVRSSESGLRLSNDIRPDSRSERVGSDTPMTPRRTAEAKTTIITIDSSPMTPKSDQRLIINWLSPEVRLASPSPLKTAHQNGAKSEPRILRIPLQSSPPTKLNILPQEEALSVQEPSLNTIENLSDLKKGTIRCRKSVVGAWQLGESSPDIKEGKQARHGKSWRLSQVEILDLT